MSAVQVLLANAVLSPIIHLSIALLYALFHAVTIGSIDLEATRQKLHVHLIQFR